MPVIAASTVFTAPKTQLRYDTAANWTTANTVLSAGEPGFESDTRRSKHGDGVTPWNALPYDAITSPQISDSTTAGRTLLTAADAAAQRTALDLEITTVDNVAALKALSSPVGLSVTLGYYSIGDRGGSTYYYDATSTASDNGGTVIIPASNPPAGRWLLLPLSGDNHVSVKLFGAKGDGKYYTGGTATAGSTTFTVPSGPFAATDVGKMIQIGGAGTSNATHVTTISGFTNATTVTLAVAAITTVASAKVSFGSNDYAAIIAARNYCWSQVSSFRGGLPLSFPSGRYCFNGDLELARSSWSVIAEDDDVWLVSFRTTSGHGVSLNGLNYDATYGAYRFQFGGAHRMNVMGNSNCQAALYYNNIHFSDVKANIRDGNIAILGDKTGNAASPGAAVDTDFDIRVAHHDFDSFHSKPATGWYMTETYACRIKMQIEVSGSSAPTFGVYMVNCNGNVFNGGTVESCSHGGLWLTSTCTRNTFIGMHNEFNGNGPDWQIDGTHTVLIGCAGAGTSATLATPANIINGNYTQIIGGEYNDLDISASAQYVVAQGANLTVGTITDNSTTTTAIGCNGLSDRAPPPPIVAPTLLNTASNEAGYRSSGYYRARDGSVGIEGHVRVATVGTLPQTIFTLPVGLRPSTVFVTHAFNLSTGGSYGLQVNSSGNVQIYSGVASGQLISLALMFRPA